MKCHDLLDCGHKCPLKCHPYKHTEIICPAKCQRKLPCNHACQRLCGDSPCLCPCEAFARLSIVDDDFETGPAFPQNLSTITLDLPQSSTRTDWQSRSNVFKHAPTDRKKTPSPKKSQQSKLDSPGGWTKYADGGVVQDDRRLADNLRQQQLQTLPRLPEVLDNDNLELNYARQWQNGTTTNPVRYVEPPVLAEGIISETTQRISDGNGGYRTIYKHHYGPIRPNLLVAGHNLDGGASTEEEPLIEL